MGKVSNSGTDPSMETGSDSFYSQASRRRHFPSSSSNNSTVRLVYAESSVSSLNKTAESAPSMSTEESSEESQWLFYVQDGAVLEIPVVVHSSSTVTSQSKMAKKLASFPNVPTSPFLSPFPSPLPSSMSQMRQVPSSTKTSAFSGSGLGLSLLDDSQIVPSSFLSPNWVSGGGSSALPSSTMLGLGLSGLENDLPPTPRNSLDLAPIKNLLSSSPVISAPSPTRSARLARRPRHVHFESADFRPTMANIPKHKHRSVMFSKARKTCFRKRKVYRSSPIPEEVRSSAPLPVITVCARQGLSSSFSSTSIVEGQRRRRTGGRVRGCFWNGCWNSVEDASESCQWDFDEQSDDYYWETRMRRANENQVRRGRNLFYGMWRRAWF